jgi:NTE family protein
LVRWRCGLSAAERRRLGAPAGWNCRDVRFFIARVGFDQLDEERAKKLDEVPTRFKLPQDQVELVIEAGRDALQANKAYIDFLRNL